MRLCYRYGLNPIGFKKPVGFLCGLGLSDLLFVNMSFTYLNPTGF